MIWFTADEHYDHEAIIAFENRPFKKLSHMKSALVKANNEIVDVDDDVFHIGDFSLRGINYKRWYEDLVSKLSGKHHLILGNHDRMGAWDYVDVGFVTVHTALELQEFVLIHDPAASIIDKTRTFLCGHVHSLFTECKNVINVGVDVRNFKPMPINEVRSIVRILS